MDEQAVRPTIQLDPPKIERKKERPTNPWKWAFIVLLFLGVFALLFVAKLIGQTSPLFPETSPTPHSPEITQAFSPTIIPTQSTNSMSGLIGEMNNYIQQTQGIPIEGYTATMYLKGFHMLSKSDFHMAKIQCGHLELINNELQSIFPDGSASHSACDTIGNDALEHSLQNFASRNGVAYSPQTLKPLLFVNQPPKPTKAGGCTTNSDCPPRNGCFLYECVNGGCQQISMCTAE